MKILSVQEAAKLVNFANVSDFFDGPNWSNPDNNNTYFLPVDSGKKVGLATIMGNLFAERGSSILWINEPHIWSSSEHPDILTRYRLSYGEHRTLYEAPVHYFESPTDRDALISIICLNLFFIWGFELATLDGSVAITVSHDEWLDYRFGKGTEFTHDFEQWIKPVLRVKTTLAP